MNEVLLVHHTPKSQASFETMTQLQDDEAAPRSQQHIHLLFRNTMRLSPCNRNRLLTALVAASCAVTTSAIYGKNHWNHVKKLTEDNFEETIQTEIQAKTFFVRWIASEG